MALLPSSALKPRMHPLYTIILLCVFAVLLTGGEKGGKAALSTDGDSWAQKGKGLSKLC